MASDDTGTAADLAGATHPGAPATRRRAVFLSYASEDTEPVARIAAALAAAGIDVWFDRSELRGGDAWDQKIRRQIKDCALFAPVISAHAAERHEGYFRLEWALADERSRMIAPNKPFLVPITIDGTLDADAPESFHRVQWTRLDGGVTPPEFAARVVALLDGRTPLPSALQLAPPAPHTRDRRLPWIAAAAVALLAIGGVVAWQATPRGESADAETVAAQKTLAVMPFRDLSPAQDLAYLADGLAEELSARLGRTPGLQLTAFSSTRRFADRTDDPAAIGRELGVGSLLQGSVRLEGSRLLVTASLVDAASGRTRWSESYSRPIDDVFDVQREIAQAILNRVVDGYVAPPAGAADAVATTTTDAYVMYLRGREQFRLRTPESMRGARRFFEQAVALDPEYAPGYVGLADTVRLLAKGPENLGDLDPAIAAELAKQNVDRALLRDPQLPSAYAALGNVAAMGGRNEEALAAFDKAIQLDPNYADAHMWRFLVLRNLARSRDALGSLETAKKLDPLSPVILRNWAIEQARRKNVPEALEVFDRLIALDPQSPVGYRGAAQVAYSSGDWLRSADYWHEVLKRSPDTGQYRVALGSLFMDAGLPAPAAKLLGEDDYRVNLVIAAGDHARALEIIRFTHASKPDDPLVTFERGWYEMLWGEREKGRELLRSIDGTILGTGWFDRNFCSPHIEMAYAFPAGPERARWLDKCRQYVAEQVGNGYSYPELSYMAARVAALDGDLPAARRAFAEAVETGWRQPWTANDPLLAEALADPAAQQALAKLEAARAAARPKLEAKAREWGYMDAGAAGGGTPMPAGR